MTALEQPGLWDVPEPPPPVEPRLTRESAPSAGRKLTLRQLEKLKKGFNPLGQRLHIEAAPRDDRSAPGRRCGNCVFRSAGGVGGTAGTYPKCFWRPGDEGGFPRITGGPATDCRSWWPGCADHEYGDPRLSDDAARSGPVTRS